MKEKKQREKQRSRKDEYDNKKKGKVVWHMNVKVLLAPCSCASNRGRYPSMMYTGRVMPSLQRTVCHP